MPTTTQPNRWYHDLAYFAGGLFLANVFPHFVAGITGQRFQSPFASPPGIGLSSPVSNVAWSLMNLAVAYVLLGRVGSFEPRRWRHALTFGSGFALAALLLARYFGKLHAQ